MKQGDVREPLGTTDAAVTARGDVVQIHLEEVGRHSWKDALFSAVVGAGGGPLYRFVAAAPSGAHTDAERTAVGAKFPLEPFQDLREQSDDEWSTLAALRLAELDAELKGAGWRSLPENGPHWWSHRYER